MAVLWDEVRRDFPGLEGKVYLTAAATSPTPRPVREAVERFYRQIEEEGDGPWDEWMAHREAVRAKVARFVGAEAAEIAFVPNPSAGANLVGDKLRTQGPGASG